MAGTDARLPASGQDRIDFDRVIVAHGDVQESGGYALIRDGYAWLREGR